MGRFLGDAKGAPISKERVTLLRSPDSIHDLIALRAQIAEHDPAAAKRVALHILYCVEYLLSENPKLGAPGRVPGTRELVIPKTPFIVPYRVRGSKIEIARVYHASRRWPDRL
jgi:plasmid stabilization system protein ParE